MHGRRARISLNTPLPYPDPVAEAALRLQRRVAERVGALTGLAVSPPRMRVTRLAPAGGAPAVPAGPDGVPERTGRTRRPWSARRVPSALLALAAAAVFGTATADLVRVHQLGLPPAVWRTWVLDRLGTLSPGDPAVTALGAAAALAGLALVVLAVTPGLRRLRPAAAPPAGAPRSTAPPSRPCSGTPSPTSVAWAR